MKLTIEMIQNAINFALKKSREPEMHIVSPEAYKMALRILEIDPNCILTHELYIWAKARELGLIDSDKGSK
jgi:hypothetical protein